MNIIFLNFLKNLLNNIIFIKIYVAELKIMCYNNNDTVAI